MKVVNKHFNFTSDPFSKGIDVDSLLITDTHQEILSRLEFCAEDQKFAVLTSGCGAGKTTILRKFINDIDKTKYEVFYISDSNLTPMSLYRQMLMQLGHDFRYYKGEAKNQLHKELEYLRNNINKKIILIIDEAHLAIKKTIEEIRFLLNFEMDSFSPLALILVGQNELLAKFNKEYFMAVKQRVEIVCKLPYLNEEQTEKYIRTHLTSVGCDEDIFTDSAVELIYKYSTGIPRNINNICNQSLLRCAIRKHKEVDSADIEYVYEHEIL